MKILWCWRCKTEVPMLEEEEYAKVAVVYTRAMQATKDFREQYHLPLEAISMDERFSPVCTTYNQITGFNETNANAVMHHRLSLYGMKCPRCEKPFRTLKASFCAECGYNPTQAEQTDAGNRRSADA